MGPRPAQRNLVLVCKHRLIHSFADRCPVMAAQHIQTAATCDLVLYSVYFLLPDPEPDQSSALGVGQHQSTLPLVCSFCAAGGMAARAMVAATFICPMVRSA